MFVMVVMMTIVVWHVVTVVVVSMSIVTPVVLLFWLWAGFRNLIADIATSREDLDADLNVVFSEDDNGLSLVVWGGNELNFERSVVSIIGKGFAVEERQG